MFRKNLSLIFSLFVLSSFVIGLSGCEDDNGSAKAQSCLDRIDDTVAQASIITQVDVCLAHVASDTSQKANVIKCSAHLLRGGLTSTKIIGAVQALSDSGARQEAAMISALALEDLDDATNANAFCSLTGIDGLIYFSSLSLMGTVLLFATGNDGTTPNAATIETMLDACQVQGACSPVVVGTAIIALSGSYCEGAESDSEMCIQLNQSITGGATPEDIASQFWANVDQ